MEPRAWPPGDPATRRISEEEVVAQLAWPRDPSEDPGRHRARALGDLERLVRLGLPYRRDGAARRFDPYEVFFFMRWAQRRFDDPLWSEVLAVARGYASEHRALGAAAAPFSLRFEREVRLDARRPGARLRTQLPLPEGDGEQRDVRVALRAVPGVSAQRDGALLDVRAEAPPGEPGPRSALVSMDWSLRVGWRGVAVDPARVEPLRPPAPEDAPLLAAAEGPIRVTDRVRALAAELAGDARTPWDALRGFWRFLFLRLTLGRIHGHALSKEDPLSSLLDSGRADCYWASALLVALCRARGIPARLVSGYFLYGRCQTNHCWMELRVPPYGFVPCDLWSWTLADGDVDSEWGSWFLGRVDPRVVIERLPRRRLILDRLSAAPTYELQLPREEPEGHGVTILRRALADDALLCREELCLKARGDEPAGA